MWLTLKCSDDNRFGFVETYKPYSFSTGAVKLRLVADAGWRLAEPYVMRGGRFIPAKEIDEEMGISRYIKAKKPFYSVLGTGNIVVDMRVVFDLKTLEYLPDESSFSIYGIVKNSLVLKDDEWGVEIRRISSVSDELVEWLNDVAAEIASMGYDKEAFLKSRF